MPALIQYRNNVPGVKIILDKPVFHIGRKESCDLCIDDELASREHALIEKIQSEQDNNLSNYVLRDLDSTNGTYVNHNRIKAHLLEDEDIIRIGQTFFKFIENEAIALDETRVLKKTFIPGVFYTKDKK